MWESETGLALQEQAPASAQKPTGVSVSEAVSDPVVLEVHVSLVDVVSVMELVALSLVQDSV